MQGCRNDDDDDVDDERYTRCVVSYKKELLQKIIFIFILYYFWLLIFYVSLKKWVTKLFMTKGHTHFILASFRASRRKITVSGKHNRLTYCVIFVLYTL